MGDHDLWLAARVVDLAESAAIESEAACVDLLMETLANLLAPAEIALLAEGGGGVEVSAASTGRARELASLVPQEHYRAVAEPVFNQPVGQLAELCPTFFAKTGEAGFRTISMLPMQWQEQIAGVVVVLDSGARLLSQSDLRSAEILARAGAIAVSQGRELREKARAAGQLQHALDSRVLIEQAKGATAARLGITPDAAFALLRAHARRESCPLAEIARRTVSGELSAHDLIAPRQHGRATSTRP